MLEAHKAENQCPFLPGPAREEMSAASFFGPYFESDMLDCELA